MFFQNREPPFQSCALQHFNQQLATYKTGSLQNYRAEMLLSLLMPQPLLTVRCSVTDMHKRGPSVYSCGIYIHTSVPTAHNTCIPGLSTGLHFLYYSLTFLLLYMCGLHSGGQTTSWSRFSPGQELWSLNSAHQACPAGVFVYESPHWLLPLECSVCRN